MQRLRRSLYDCALSYPTFNARADHAFNVPVLNVSGKGLPTVSGRIGVGLVAQAVVTDAIRTELVRLARWGPRPSSRPHWNRSA